MEQPVLQSTPHLEDYFNILCRRRWIIITFLTVLVTTVLIGSIKQTPIYQATATILVEMYSPKVILFKEVSPMGAENLYEFKNYYETQYILLKSRSLMENVLRSLELPFNSNTDQDPVENLLKIVKINPVKNSKIIKVHAEHPDPVMAAKISNAVVNEFIKFNLGRNLHASTEAATWLAKKIEVQKKKLRNSEQVLQKYRNEHNIKILPLTTGEYATEEIRAEYAKYQTLLDMYSKRYTAKHPKMKELKEQIKSLKNKIYGLGDVGIEDKTMGYRALEREVRANKQMTELLLSRMKEIDLYSTLNFNNITLVDPAVLPRNPIRPNIKLNITLAVFIGLVLGIALAFFIEYLDRTIKSSRDVKYILKSHFIGGVPNIREKNPIYQYKIAHLDPRSHVAEAYRLIRTEILHLVPQQWRQLTAILITSGVPISGKTITATNLAISFAQKGNRVLLVDGDMRVPQLHNIFNVEQPCGLSEYLTGEATVNQIIKNIDIQNISIVTSGKIHNYPAEIISRPKIETLIKCLKGRFDYVIFDSPPILGLTDGIMYAEMVDAIIHVVRSGKTSISIALRAKDQLSFFQNKVLGIILNDISLLQEDYYYYRRYGYYNKIENKKLIPPTNIEKKEILINKN